MATTGTYPTLAPTQQQTTQATFQQPASERFLIAAKMDDPNKQDLDDTARAVQAGIVARGRVALAMNEPTLLLESYLAREMLVGGATAMELFRAWTQNHRTGQERRFTSLDQAMAGTPGFQSAAGRFEARVLDNLRAQHRAGQVDYHDLVTGTGPVRRSFDSAAAMEAGRATQRMLPGIGPPLVSLELVADRACKICIGSIQGIQVWVKHFQWQPANAHVSLTLEYQIRDHFGVDDDDCEVSSQGLHGTPGQVAMWVLQHHRRPGHCPWITVVHVERMLQAHLI